MVGSNAHGARVFVDDVPKGEVPLRLDAVLVGYHRIRVEHPEYETGETAIQVIEGRIQQVVLRLRKLTPELMHGRTVTSQPLLVWADAGLGLADVGGAATLGLNVASGDVQLALRCLGLKRCFLESCGTDIIVRSCSGSAGIRKSSRFAHVAALGGLSLLHARQLPAVFSDDRPIDSTTVGLTVGGEAWVHVVFIGLGIRLFVNLNYQIPFAGMNILVQLGKLL
jgi:hypothetical protein